jgi:hypothetical protein
MVVPDVRRHVLPDAHAGLLQARHGVGRRRLDHVDRIRQERRGAAGILGRADQHQPVGLGEALGIPVALVLHQLGALTWHQASELEGTCPRRLRRHLVPVLALLLPVGRAGDQEPQHLIGKERIDRLGLYLHRHVVDLLVARDRRQARANLRRLALVELRRVLVEDLFEVPQDGVCVEGRTVVELHAWPELEGPQRLVGVVDLPFGGEAGDQLARPVGDIKLPGDQRIVDREAGELVGASAAIGLAGGERDVGQRDAVAHDLLSSARADLAKPVGRASALAPARIERRERRVLPIMKVS